MQPIYYIKEQLNRYKIGFQRDSFYTYRFEVFALREQGFTVSNCKPLSLLSSFTSKVSTVIYIEGDRALS